ncbi:MAG: tyrosine-type recombinase/integrase [Methanothrix sp.]
MKRKKLAIKWHLEESVDLGAPLRRYKRYLEDQGFRQSTVESYVGNVKRYLDFAQTDRPSIDTAAIFRDSLHDRNLGRSTINNYSFAVISYHRMHDEIISFPFMKRNDEIPSYFSEDEVSKIFSVCGNLKHLAMLQVLFYGCLRASELCNLDDKDLDLKSMIIRIREGKGGRDGISYISEECARILKQYLELRPPLVVNGTHPLFYTDFGNRWDRRDVHRMFQHYKKMAGVERAGGVHVFARHTAASILVANGCDLRHVKELLRHRDIRTTLRYAHVGEKTLREKYNHCLVLR